MSVQIKDGTGRGFLQEVNSSNQASVTAVVTATREHASTKHGDTAIWTSTYSATGGDEVLSIANSEPDRRLHISQIWFSSSVASLWTFFLDTSGNTAGGTGITYVNPSKPSGVARSNAAFGNAAVTGTLAGDAVGIVSAGASSPSTMNFHGTIILGNGDIFAVTLATTGVCAVTVVGWWEHE